MKMKDGCLPCVVNQVIKVADITDAKEREKLYRHAFAYLLSLIHISLQRQGVSPWIQ